MEQFHVQVLLHCNPELLTLHDWGIAHGAESTATPWPCSACGRSLGVTLGSLVGRDCEMGYCKGTFVGIHWSLSISIETLW